MQLIDNLIAALDQNGYAVGLKRIPSGYLLNLVDDRLDREASYGFTEAEVDQIVRLIGPRYCTPAQCELLLHSPQS